MKKALILVLMAVGVGCGGDDGDNNTGPKDAGIDSPAVLDASCFNNPTTHYEIINACTTAQQIFKDSHPPLLKPDGTLPALPP